LLTPRLALVLAVFAATLPISRAAPADLLDVVWAQETSKNFTVVGPIGHRAARQLAQDLELFRQVVLTLTGAPSSTAVVSTQVLAVEDSTEWSELGLPEHVGGVFLPSWRENRLALIDHDDPVHRTAAKHGYVHFLFANRNPHAGLLWYEEGCADLLSTVRRNRDRVEVGMVPDWVEAPLAVGNWMPLRKLFEPEVLADATIEQRRMFRAESWALVQYLMIGSSYKETFTTRLAAYTDAVARGIDPQAAFEAAFDTPVATLDLKLRRDVKRGR
jgi:hypothetical protein